MITHRWADHGTMTDHTTTNATDVTAEIPDSQIHTTGMDYTTLIGSNEEDTIVFYRDLLGMSLVLRQPHLDTPDVTYLLFDTGGGRLLTFFVAEDRQLHNGPQRPGIGAVHHLPLRIAPERFVDVRDALVDDGRQFNEFDRGAFHSLYTHEHNGLVIELSTEKYRIPDTRRGEVLATTRRIRPEEGELRRGLTPRGGALRTGINNQ